MSNEQESNGQADGQNTQSNSENTENKEIESGEGKDTPEPKLVSKEAYEKVMADMHKFKKMVKEYESKNKQAELNALKEKQEWQKIAELKEKEAQEAFEQSEMLKKAVITDKKMSAIRTAAMKAGVLDSALDDIDLISWNDVVVETTSTGKINVTGVEDAIKRLKLQKPHWFGKTASKINGRVPETKGSSGLVTAKDLVKLEKEAKESGDYSAYTAAYNNYKAQKIGQNV